MRGERSQQIAGPSRGFGAAAPTGALFVVSVPIGDPDDLSARALRILREVDIIASETPAATRTLLLRHRLKEAAARLTGYGPGNLKEKVRVLLHRLQAGARIALVADCGCPVIADPGSLLVASAHANGIRVVPVPGPSAIMAALMVSGFAADRFSFHGRVPTGPTSMKVFLVRLLQEAETGVALCEPQSLNRLFDLIARLAPRRRLALGCDLTEETETILTGTASQIRNQAVERLRPRAITLVVAGQKRRRMEPSPDS